jgi:hypothetical protein
MVSKSNRKITEKEAKLIPLTHIYMTFALFWHGTVISINKCAHTSLSPIRREFASGFVNYKKGCARLAVASDTAYQLLAHGRCFSPG